MKNILTIILLVLVQGLLAQTAKLPRPTKDANYILDSAQMMPYTQVQLDYQSDSLRMNIYDETSRKLRIIKSVDGVNWNSSYDIIGRVESATRYNNSPFVWYGLEHVWDASGTYCRQLKIYSADNGVTWIRTTDSVSDGSTHFGEDHTVTYNPEDSLYYIYIRPEASNVDGKRKISLIKTSDYGTFTTRVPIFPANNFYNPNSKDYYKGFYNGVMFKTAPNQYWFYCNVINCQNSTVYGELSYAEDGINFRRCNDTNAFIPLNGSAKEIYGNPTVIGDTLYIYTFESPYVHGGIDYWRIQRYRLPLSDLMKWKVPALTPSRQSKLKINK